MTAKPLTVVPLDQCWNRIGVRGDRSCPELEKVTHCNNCPVFAAAGRRFLDAPSPPGYLAEWTQRLAVREEVREGDESSVLVFRLGDEWLALPVAVLVEVTRPRPLHRIPHRGGLLAGLANIRGELHLCVRLDLILGVTVPPDSDPDLRRLVVIRRETEGWVFAADEVDQVHRVLLPDLASAAPTLARSHGKLTRGVFPHANRAIGLLDDGRLFQTLRERLR
ncbi:protein : Chemotaxis signal transduction protein OS=Singulisphaera acidiphila (strain ATCC BAA-1392 / DSM 18658 / VKM B-2454 / MOB10) GN=Sinac_4832 PE=4 SV=1: CheW [Gemmata massiliana]|uniref:Chemotaxis protein CheW n=1 Tax=Gemmata massiliana TaxID=1210884 RepID=A0A6P2DDW4_9BACT|nr:chemotaxis protein CheW [Gemmata massiliana]VTR97592.1 protein : Chemotaxis signal transduction protein OS=Singulisphaera acidiphila (strain ATCC BAA-1392 / DSM 18658 / VKM B-2454 / MOB10) GN=Sinac_4832 PE=4 SV=1: CheW [Gemmata massiliana]